VTIKGKRFIPSRFRYRCTNTKCNAYISKIVDGKGLYKCKRCNTTFNEPVLETTFNVWAGV
jgi:hypothetical protein